VTNQYYAKVDDDVAAGINIKADVAMHTTYNQCAGLLQTTHHQPTSWIHQSCHAWAETILFEPEVPWLFLSPESMSQKFCVLAYWLSTEVFVCRRNLQCNQACPASIINSECGPKQCIQLNQASLQERSCCIISNESAKQWNFLIQLTCNFHVPWLQNIEQVYVGCHK